MNSIIKPSQLVEHVADWHNELKIDRTNRTVRNVALTGVTSKNGYRYTEQALREAAILYQDKPVFLDHAVDKSRPHERSTRDLVGTIVNPRFDSGRIRGDIRILDTDSGRTFLALSESDAPGVGMSHVVLAQRAAADGAVDRIHDVVSVDAVVFPATTKSFRESVVDPSETASTHIDAESVSSTKLDTDASATACPRCRSTDPTRSAEATPEAADSGVREQFQQLLSERDELLRELRDIRDRQADQAQRARLEQQLREARLPEYALSVQFRRQLLASDEPTRASLVAERLQLIETAARKSPCSVERAIPSQSADANHAFIFAIKRSRH